MSLCKLRTFWRLPAGLAFLGPLLCGLTTLSAAESLAPDAYSRAAAKVTAAILNRQHLLQPSLDDELSKRSLGLFLKALDPRKVYFRQSDIDEFTQHDTKLDDWIREGDVDFAFRVLARLVQRIPEQTELAARLLADRPDFTVNEEFTIDGDKLRFARNDDEATERWRLQIKYDWLVLRVGGYDDEAVIARLNKRYQRLLAQAQKTDVDELMEVYLSAFCQAVDPHSGYLSRKSMTNFSVGLIRWCGIGAMLQRENGYAVVRQILPGSPAEKVDDLQLGDKIIGIGEGREGELSDVVGMPLADVVRRTRGKRGTVVRLEVVAFDGSNRRAIELTRTPVKIPTTRSRVIERARQPGDEPILIGVIDPPSMYMDFSASRGSASDYRGVSRDAQRILEDFKRRRVAAVVLDLSRCGGGSFTESINLSGLFLDKGPIVQVVDQKGEPKTHGDEASGTTWDGPLVVVTSRLTSPSVEVFAGAIQDYRRGLTVGAASTCGRGTVQSLVDLGKWFGSSQNPLRLGAAKITMQQLFRPGGDAIQRRGIRADVPLPSLFGSRALVESDLEFALPFTRIQPAEFTPCDHVDRETIRQLNELSSARRCKSEFFRQVQATLRDGAIADQPKFVSLNEKQFLRRQRERTDPKIIADGAYLDEVLSITMDYLAIKGQKKPA